MRKIFLWTVVAFFFGFLLGDPIVYGLNGPIRVAWAIAGISGAFGFFSACVKNACDEHEKMSRLADDSIDDEDSIDRPVDYYPAFEAASKRIDRMDSALKRLRTWATQEPTAPSDPSARTWVINTINNALPGLINEQED